MRDVTPAPQKKHLWILEIFLFLFEFLKNPFRNISKLPDWTWPQLILLQISLSMGSGILSGLLPPNIYKIFAGILLAPIISSMMSLLMALFLYYYFQLFENKTVSIKKLLILIVLANSPFFIFETGSEILPPLTLVGFSFTSILMAIGLTENFQLEKKKSLKLVGGILIIVFVIWLWNRISLS